jgi:hypothetical protein
MTLRPRPLPGRRGRRRTCDRGNNRRQNDLAEPTRSVHHTTGENRAICASSRWSPRHPEYVTQIQNVVWQIAPLSILADALDKASSSQKPLVQLNETKRFDESPQHYPSWRVVLACFLVALFIFGFGIYGHGVYLVELQRMRGLTNALISRASTLSYLLGSVLAVYTNDILVWMGPKRLVLLGISALAAATSLFASAEAWIESLSPGWSRSSAQRISLGLRRLDESAMEP